VSHLWRVKGMGKARILEVYEDGTFRYIDPNTQREIEGKINPATMFAIMLLLAATVIK